MTLTSFGDLWSWGNNRYGELGLGCDTDNFNTPQKVNLSKVLSINCGTHHNVAITSNDDIYVWGCNYLEQLGLEDTKSRNTPCKLIIK